MNAEDVSAILNWLPFAAGAAALLGLGWWSFRGPAGRWLLPPQRHRAVPWRWAQVAVVFAVFVLFWGEFLLLSFRVVPVLAWVYGPETQEAFEATFHREPGTPLSDEARMAFGRARQWVNVLFLPLQVGCICLTLWAWSGTRPYQLGMTAHRLGRNVLVGLLAWVAVTPFLYVLNLTLTWLMERWGLSAADAHPLTKLGQSSAPLADRVVLVLAATLAAPVIEELFFRGILQPWLSGSQASRPSGPFRKPAARQGLVLGLALFFAWTSRMPGGDDLGTFLRGMGESFLRPATLFIVILSGAYLAWRWWLGRPGDDGSGDPFGAVFTSAVFFAAAHSAVWPSPVALFLFGLVLGYLAYRTQSLVPSIVLHGLFNGVSCVLLFFLPHLVTPQSPKGNEETTAVVRPALVSTSTAVPGSQWPRRR